MRRMLMTGAAVLLGLAGTAVSASAQDVPAATAPGPCSHTHATNAQCTITASMSVTVQKMVVLERTAGSDALTQPAAHMFATDPEIWIPQAVDHELQVRANTDWQLHVYYTAWTMDTDPYPAKNGDLEYHDGTDWTPVGDSGSPSLLDNGNATNETPVTLQLRVRWEIETAEPGAYTVGLVYRLSSP